ncbi:mitotic apparatus protein p62-like [Papaver somniferum]|uniref:mitotic apparatus protein p62-like n=1 Tax=Papaver somniferum TaxID=3469 RepID=UPI000E6F4FB4|nr:mitotic apparatus protein p62-like [Papaver somniferum]
MGRHEKRLSFPQDISKLPERPTKRSSASIRRGDRLCNKDIVDEVDKDTLVESDNASGSSDEDSKNDEEDEAKSDDEENSYEDDNKVGDEYDEESNHEDDEENFGEVDVGRASSSGKGKKVVEESEIPRKPINPRLLSYYRDHIARLVWENENPRENPIPLLKLHQHQDLVK